MLSKCPNIVHIRASDPHRLAAELAKMDIVESLQFEGEDQALQISVRTPIELFQQLPKLTAEHGIAIHEVRSADESLSHLFSTLMRMHRGELVVR